MDWLALCNSDSLFPNLVLDFVVELDDPLVPLPQLGAGDRFSVVAGVFREPGGVIVAAANDSLRIQFGGQEWLLRPLGRGELGSGIRINMRRRTWVIVRQL